MRKFFKISFFAFIAAIAMGFSSCNTGGGSGEDLVTDQLLQNCYFMVTDMQNNSTQPDQIVNPVTVKLQLNWSNDHGAAWINGLKIGSMTYPTITLEDFKWKYDSETGWCYTTTEPEIGESVTGITPAITDFQFKWVDRLDFSNTLGAYDPGCLISFVVDGRYRVVGWRNPIILGGTTTSTDPKGEEYTTKRTIYSVQLDFMTRLANIGIVQAHFSGQMPEMNMMFKGIPFTVDNYGRTVTLQVGSLTPEIENTPQPSFPISNLKATVTPGTGMQLEFDCNVRNANLYKVKANVDYVSYGEAIM